MCNGEKSYIAYAVTKSKTFKTAKGADAFMVRNGFGKSNDTKQNEDNIRNRHQGDGKEIQPH